MMLSVDFFLLGCIVSMVHACSTTVVGRLASATGAVIASHSNDGDGGGFYHSSINRVLAADWLSNATRHVNGHEIPQVPHTYAYFTEGYAAMNEHQVSVGADE